MSVLDRLQYLHRLEEVTERFGLHLDHDEAEAERDVARLNLANLSRIRFEGRPLSIAKASASTQRKETLRFKSMAAPSPEKSTGETTTCPRLDAFASQSTPPCHDRR